MRNENQMFVYETIIRSECHRLKLFQNKIKKICKSLALKVRMRVDFPFKIIGWI